LLETEYLQNLKTRRLKTTQASRDITVIFLRSVKAEKSMDWNRFNVKNLIKPPL